jgi:TonB family protein
LSGLWRILVSTTEEYTLPQLPSSGNLYHDGLGQTGPMVLGDGSSLVLVARELVAQICAEVEARVRIASREDTEIGGLLIGPKPLGSDLLVEEAIPLGIEYHFGPTSPALLAGLDSLLASFNPAAADQHHGSRSILGFYRILTRSGSNSRDSGFEILTAIGKAHRSLSDIQCCFVLAPVSGSEILLRVLMRNGGGWEEIQQVTLPREPMASTAVAAAATQRVVPSSAPEPSPQLAPKEAAADLNAAAAPLAAVPQPGPVTKTFEPPRGGGWQRNAAIFAAAALVLVAASGGVYRWMNKRHSYTQRDSRVESPPPSRVGFSANREGASWKLTWDSAAVKAKKPTGANLSIQDGASRKDYALTIADLSSGTMYYFPKSGALAFRLRLVRDGVAIAEASVRVPHSIKPAPDQRSEFRKLQTPEVARSNPAPQPAARGSFVPPSAISRPPAQLAPTLTAGPPITTPVVPLLSPRELSPVYKAPSPLLGISILGEAPRELNIAAKTAPAPARAPEGLARSATVTQPPQATVAQPLQDAAPVPTNVAPPSTPPQATFVAPKPIRQMQPLASPDTEVNGSSQVKVLVAINEKGRVTKITSAAPGQDIRLVEAAVKAAQLWEFEPARLNGRVVPSEITLVFRF